MKKLPTLLAALLICATALGDTTNWTTQIVVTNIATNANSVTINSVTRYWTNADSFISVLTNLAGVNQTATNLYNNLRVWVPLNPPLAVTMPSNQTVKLYGTEAVVTIDGGWGLVLTTSNIVRTVKVTALPNTNSMTAVDLAMIVTEPSTTPTSQSIQASNLDHSLRAIGHARLETTNLTLLKPDSLTTNGVLRSTDNSIVLDPGGSVNRILLNTNVGIGTNAPAEKLHVHGDTYALTSKVAGITLRNATNSARLGQMAYRDLRQKTSGSWDTFFADGIAVSNLYFYNPDTKVMQGMITCIGEGMFALLDEDGYTTCNPELWFGYYPDLVATPMISPVIVWDANVTDGKLKIYDNTKTGFYGLEVGDLVVATNLAVSNGASIYGSLWTTNLDSGSNAFVVWPRSRSLTDKAVNIFEIRRTNGTLTFSVGGTNQDLFQLVGSLQITNAADTGSNVLLRLVPHASQVEDIMRILRPSGATSILVDTNGQFWLTEGTTLLRVTNVAEGMFLRRSGNTITGDSGSTAVPGGSGFDIQFNNGGAFLGDADFRWYPASNALVLSDSAQFYMKGAPVDSVMICDGATRRITAHEDISVTELLMLDGHTSLQEGSANLTAFSGITTNTLLDMVSAKQYGSANLTNYSGVSTNTLLDMISAKQYGSANLTNFGGMTTNTLLDMVSAKQYGSANLTNWSGTTTNAVLDLVSTKQYGTAYLTNWGDLNPDAYNALANGVATNLWVTNTGTNAVALTVQAGRTGFTNNVLEVKGTNGATALKVGADGGVTIQGATGTAGGFDLYESDGTSYTRVKANDSLSADNITILPTQAGTLALLDLTNAGAGTVTITTSGTVRTFTVLPDLTNVGAGTITITTNGMERVFTGTGGGGSNIFTLTVSNTFRMMETNIIVSTTNAVHLDLSHWNVFKLWMLTNCHLVFTNTYAGLVNGLVYFQQDTNGFRDILTWTVGGGLIQTNASLALTTNGSALDLLEIRGGFFSTNLIAYWPQNFLPRTSYTNSLTPYQVVSYPGEIKSITIQDNGWLANVDVYQMATNGTFDYGFAGSTNNILASTNFLLTVLSPGFDDTGTSQQVTRYIAGTKTIRLPYPDEGVTNRIATNEVTTNITISVALSDYIGSNDIVTATVATNWYLTDVGNRANSGFGCVNSSLQGYGKVIAAWSWVPWTHETNATYTLRAVAYHRSAQDGRPVRAIKFWGREGDVSNSPVVLTGMVATVDLSGPHSICEYVASNLDNTVFSAGGGEVSNFFIAYPWVGNAESVYDCSTAGLNAFSMYAGPFHILSDHERNYGLAYAVVDRTNGVTDGTVVTNYGDLASAVAFSNISHAINAIRITNNAAYGRADQFGYVFLTNGDYDLVPSALTAGTRQKSWTVLAKHPDVADSNEVRIAGNTKSTMQTDALRKFQDISISHVTNNSLNIRGYMWFDRVVIADNTSGSSAALDANVTNIYVTRSKVGRMQGEFTVKNGGNSDRFMFRGNVFTSNSTVRPHVFLGNSTDFPTNAGMILSAENGLTTIIDPLVWSYNTMYDLRNAAAPLRLYAATPNRVGAALIQNVFEVSYDNAINELATVAWASANTNGNTNLLVWHNTFVGQRFNANYNDSTNAAGVEQNCYSPLGSWIGNVFDDYNTKHDTFVGHENGERTNRWDVMYGVGFRDNVSAEMIGGSFHPESTTANYGFDGIGWAYFQITNLATLWGFTENGALPYPTAGDGIGNGNYLPAAGSTLIGRELDLVLPFDLRGTNRYINGAIGAYEANP